MPAISRRTSTKAPRHGYGYDTIDRLTSAAYTGTPNETYAYDVSAIVPASHKSATMVIKPFNRLVSTSTASYIYNNNGNMVSRIEGTGTTQCVWDFENRLTQVVTTIVWQRGLTNTTRWDVAFKERHQVACPPTSFTTART